MKSKRLENEENIICDIEGSTTEEKTSNIIKWFMQNDASHKPKHLNPLESNAMDKIKGNKHQKEAQKQNAHKNLNKAD